MQHRRVKISCPFICRSDLTISPGRQTASIKPIESSRNCSSYPDIILSGRHFSDREHFDQRNSIPRICEGVSHVPQIRVKRREFDNGSGKTSSFLGFAIGSQTMTLSLPDAKRPWHLDLVTKVANTNLVPTVRDLASLLDQCMQQGQKIAL